VIRNIKVLGLALVAVMAMSAMVASAAQAAPVVTLTNQKGETVASAQIHGVQSGKHKFTVDGSSVECTTATFEGSATDGATWTKVHPVYTGCTAFGFLGATVTTTGCDYELMALGAGPTEYTGEIKVVCEAGKEITISAGGVCTAKVGSQTITTGNKATNSTELIHMHITLHNEESSVSVNKTQDGFGCPFAGTGATTGKYTGTTTVKAYSAAPYETKNQVNITISP